MYTNKIVYLQKINYNHKKSSNFTFEIESEI